MPYGDHVIAALHDVLIAARFEQLSTPSQYRGTLDLSGGPVPQHNVFVELTHDHVSVMAPIGPAADYDETDVDVARLAGDPFTLTKVASQAVLYRDLPEDDVAADPGCVISEAATLAEYAADVEDRLRRNKLRKAELMEFMQPVLDDEHIFANSSLTPEVLAARIVELLRLTPRFDFFEAVTGAIANLSMLSWASGSGTLRDSHWRVVLDAIEQFGAERGWRVGT